MDSLQIDVSEKGGAVTKRAQFILTFLVYSLQ